MADLNLELFNTIRRIQIRTTHLAENILAGTYHSAYKGKGIEFEEVREYQPGDDVRSIDWNVTARLGHPYVKNFREERELTVMLIVDLSSSCNFGSKEHSKRRWIAEIAALLAFAATGNSDRVGLATFADKVMTYLPPKRGKRHVLRIIRELMTAPSSSRQTNLAAALAFIGKVQRRQTVCFIISDFIAGDFSHELKLLANKHDVTAIAIVDPYEKDFPIQGIVAAADLESGEEQHIDTANSAVKESVRLNIDTRMKSLQKLLKQVNGGFIAISTDSSYLQAINHFFKLRGKRLR